MTNEELEVRCVEWQKVLGLSDWIVTVKFKRYHELTELNRGGEVTYCHPKMTAEISVLDAGDWNPTFISGEDQEKTLVHELLHLHFAHLTDSDDDNIHEEQAIELISRALVGLKRRVSS